MRIYLDSCALGRLFDDRSSERVRQEAEIIEQVFTLIDDGSVSWFASQVLEDEIRQNPRERVRYYSLSLLRLATTITMDDTCRIRAENLHQMAYGFNDARHLAAAEACNADYLITSDDRFLRRAERGTGSPKVKVISPIEWNLEVSHGASRSS